MGDGCVKEKASAALAGKDAVTLARHEQLCSKNRRPLVLMCMYAGYLCFGGCAFNRLETASLWPEENVLNSPSMRGPLPIGLPTAGCGDTMFG
eukprot:scaffold1236_cov503-Prasinococcus_capsulatus_cf.AAC.9